MELDGKKIVITGASSGIGCEVLRLLADHDADIVAVGRNIDRIPRPNGRVTPYACDVSVKENVDTLFDFAVQTMGRVDLFIANAGYAYCEQLTGADWGHIDAIYRTNVYSPLYSLEKMMELNRGRSYAVAVTCSAVAGVPLPGFALYCSTKSALDQFARTYRYEKSDRGVLSLVYPIATQTRFFRRAADAAPVPWPVQKAESVAKAYVRGIEKGKASIYPSKFYPVSFTLNRIFPFVYGIYNRVNAKSFRNWLQNRK